MTTKVHAVTDGLGNPLRFCSPVERRDNCRIKKIAILLSILVCLFSVSCSLSLHSSFSNNAHTPVEIPYDKSLVSSSENIDFSQFSILQNIKDGVPISDDMLLEYPHIYSAINKKISVDDSSITLEVSEFSGILHIVKLFSENENEYSVTLLNDSSNLNLAIISPDNSIFHLPVNSENVSITLQSGTSYLVLFGHNGSGNLTINTPPQISLSLL